MNQIQIGRFIAERRKAWYPNFERKGLRMEWKLAEQIRAYRQEKGMTQERLAEAVGVTVGAVSKWESGVSHS